MTILAIALRSLRLLVRPKKNPARLCRLQTLIANISKMNADIDKRTTALLTAILLALCKGMANIRPLTTTIRAKGSNIDPPDVSTVCSEYANAFAFVPRDVAARGMSTL